MTKKMAGFTDWIKQSPECRAVTIFATLIFIFLFQIQLIGQIVYKLSVGYSFTIRTTLFATNRFSTVILTIMSIGFACDMLGEFIRWRKTHWKIKVYPKTTTASSAEKVGK